MRTLSALILVAVSATAARADDVAIVAARFQRESGLAWRVDVTLRHADSGWEHYADAWRVVGPGGDVYGTRTLYHPHENEQPFTRSLGGVEVPGSVPLVRVEAHDKVHGWSPDVLEVDLRRERGERFEVVR